MYTPQRGGSCTVLWAKYSGHVVLWHVFLLISRAVVDITWYLVVTNAGVYSESVPGRRRARGFSSLLLKLYFVRQSDVACSSRPLPSTGGHVVYFLGSSYILLLFSFVENLQLDIYVLKCLAFVVLWSRKLELEAVLWWQLVIGNPFVDVFRFNPELAVVAEMCYLATLSVT